MQKITKNTFNKGRNSDTDKHALRPDSYVEAHNVELVSDGEFTALKNLQGTTNVQNVISGANATVLGAFENLYKIGTTSGKKCITIFTLSDSGTTVQAGLGSVVYEGYAPTAVEGINGTVAAEPGVGLVTYTGYAPAEVVSTATITLYAQPENTAANPSARFHYKIGSGSWVYLQQSSLSAGSYQVINTFSVPEGETVYLAVQNTSDADVRFGDGNGSGDYTEWFGKTTPYSFTASASSSQYLNLKTTFVNPPGIYVYTTS